jgi:flagellar hook assembly protein FlgD
MKNVLVNILRKAAVALSLALMISMGYATDATAQGKSITAKGKSLTRLATHPDVVAPKTLDMAVFQVENTLKFKVHMENYAGNNVNIRIKNANGKILYQENAKDVSKYIRKFDFSTMEDGQYTFEISNGTETLSKDISLQTLSARSLQINN